MRPRVSGSGEVHVGSFDRVATASRRVMAIPVEVGVRDDEVRRGRAVLTDVLGGVGIAHQRDVVAASNRTVQR